MTSTGPPWRYYGDYELPSRAEALAAPLRAFPSWYPRMECASSGREQYLAETHLTIAGHGDRRVGDRRLKHKAAAGSRSGLS